MSDTKRTFADLANILTRKFAPMLTSQINRATPIFSILPIRKADADYIKWVARFGTARPTTAKIADGADVTNFNADTKVPASLIVGTYHDAFGVSGKAMAAAQASGNPEQIVNLLGDELRDSMERLAFALAYEIYNGAGGTDEIMGLCDPTNGVLNLTGTYAGIARATYSQWASNVLSNGGVARALTLDLIRALDTGIYTASGRNVDVYVADPFTFEQYGKLLGDKRRYLEDVSVRGRKIVLDGGYQALEFDGKPVLRDISCPAGSFLALNTNFLEIRALPHAPNAMVPVAGEATPKGSEESQFGESSFQLPGKILYLARNGDMEKFATYVYPQLVCRRPSAQGRITDLFQS